MPGTRYPGSLYPGQYAGSVDVIVHATGVSASGAIGTIIASGSALIAASGVSATSAIGSVTASGAAAVHVAGVSAQTAIGQVVVGVQSAVPVAYLPFAIRPTREDRYHASATVAVFGVEAIGAVGRVLASGTRRAVRRPRQHAPEPLPVVASPVVLGDEAAWFEAARLARLRRDDEEWLLITEAA